MDAPQFNATKFKEAVVYVCGESEADPRFGSTKLNKILFYADFNAYTELGAPITGATYQHLPEGPAPREMLRCRGELEAEESVRLEARTYFNRQQKRPVALRTAELRYFAAREVGILNEAIAYLRDKDARESSDLSHREWGWRLTEEGEDIPYEAAWLSPDPPTQEATEHAKALASQYPA